MAVFTCAGALASGLILPVLATTATAATGWPGGATPRNPPMARGPAPSSRGLGRASGLGPPNTFVATGPLGVAQSGQTATLLRGGKVLIAAGGTTNAEL